MAKAVSTGMVSVDQITTNQTFLGQFTSKMGQAKQKLGNAQARDTCKNSKILDGSSGSSALTLCLLSGQKESVQVANEAQTSTLRKTVELESRMTSDCNS